MGFNNIDIAAAKTRGLTVTNTPDVLTDDTADIATTLLADDRPEGAERASVTSAPSAWTGWRPTHMLGTKVSGKTLGSGRDGPHRKGGREAGPSWIRHAGHLPRSVSAEARRGEGARAPKDGTASTRCCGEADFVSLHCPATPETRHLINADRLKLMKRGAFLINTARGDVVDEAALIAALKSGTIAGAGLDVYEREPAMAPELLSMENVALLPHLGSATTETRIAMGMRALENLKLFFAGQPVRDRVV